MVSGFVPILHDLNFLGVVWIRMLALLCGENGGWFKTVDIGSWFFLGWFEVLTLFDAVIHNQASLLSLF